MELPNTIPDASRVRPESTALVIIDMQRGFLEPERFGSMQYGQCPQDRLCSSASITIEASRKLGLHVMHIVLERDISRTCQTFPRPSG